jgi:hypothetical protein
MDKITKMLFDLKRELEDKRETYYEPEFDYTDLERKQGYNNYNQAIKEVNDLLGLFIVVGSEEELKCEQRQTRGHLDRCGYCNAYPDEKCRW